MPQISRWGNNSLAIMGDITENIKRENTGEIQEIRDEKGRFKPGVSGNPAGKPLGALSLTAKIKQRLLELSPDQKRTALEWLADNIVQDALDSNNKMRTLIWNYLDGMPKQSLDIGNEGELPFMINIVKDEPKREDNQAVPPTV